MQEIKAKSGNKAGKVILTVVGTLIALVVIAVIGVKAYFKPASSTAVCTNMFKITGEELKKTLGSAPDQAAIEKMSGITMANCVTAADKTYKNSPPMYSSVLSKCQVKAVTYDEFKTCEDKAKEAIRH